MLERRISLKKAFRFSALAGAAVGLMAAISGVASAAESYTFANLRWGCSPAEARKQLKSQGFKVKRVVKGPQRELVEDGAWGKWVKKDRGKRMIAAGKVGGLPTQVQLIFGHNNKLQRVIVGWKDWNGSIPHAKRLTHMANAVTKQLESRYGRSNERRDPFGWIDTARWLPASDGSRMEFMIRGTNGMLFYPGDKTGVRLNFWNTAYGGRGGAQTARGNSGGSVPRFGPGGRTQEISSKNSGPATQGFEPIGSGR
jgi:hypothetical protein